MTKLNLQKINAMHREGIIGVIRSQTRKLGLLSKKLAAGFAVDDIHRFRVEVKRLRAFIRLIGPGDRKLPKKLRRFYDAVGVVRNLQLLRQSLASFRSHRHSGLPQAIFQILDERIAAARKEAEAILDDKIAYRKVAKRLCSGLPFRLTRSQRYQFILAKFQLPNPASAHLPGDEGLHLLRKSLKDLLYAWPYLGNHARKQTACWFGGRMVMEKIAQAIGDYLDAQVRLRLLESPDIFPAGIDAALLREIRQEWRSEKDRLYSRVEKTLGKRFHLVTHQPPLPEKAVSNPPPENSILVSSELHLD
jgi:CHAD domain-containing protein